MTGFSILFGDGISFRGKSKEEMIDKALAYKLDVIGEYESVLENITLSYSERYRKSMLFF